MTSSDNLNVTGQNHRYIKNHMPGYTQLCIEKICQGVTLFVLFAVIVLGFFV